MRNKMEKKPNLVYGKKKEMTTPEKKAFILRLFVDQGTTLIETGTHLGYTISKCANFCKEVHTAEIDKNLQDGAKFKCSKFNFYST